MVNEPIDAFAWNKALYGNGGDPLHVDVYITDGTTVWGPISEDWNVAPGVLKGTVYYNSYNSLLAGSEQRRRPRHQARRVLPPPSRCPARHGSCHVCHEVSANGVHALHAWTPRTRHERRRTTSRRTARSSSYSGNAPDGTSNNRKFLWSGVYPDGTFAHDQLDARARAQHARLGPLRRDNGNKVTYGGAITETGWTNVVTQAVTPAVLARRSASRLQLLVGPRRRTTSSRVAVARSTSSTSTAARATSTAARRSSAAARTYAFYNLRELYYESTTRYVGWPALHARLEAASSSTTPSRTARAAAPTARSPRGAGAQAELWYTDARHGRRSRVRMNWLERLRRDEHELPADQREPRRRHEAQLRAHREPDRVRRLLLGRLHLASHVRQRRDR